jgi:hypothetical protein
MLELSVSFRRMAEAMTRLQELDPGVIDAAYVRSIIRTRRLRDRFFPSGLFADPAWDMLPELYAARLERHAVAVSSLCIPAVPPTMGESAV